MNNKDKFITTYEEKIKPLRENYYKTKVTAGLGDNVIIKSMIIINYIPLILAILLCLVGSFSLKSKIVALLFLIVASYLLSIVKNTYNMSETKYEIAIRKLGYLTINQYEKNIEKYITGPDGYYAEVLQHIINKYKITEENTYSLKDLKGRTYLIHYNKDKDEVYLINNDFKDTPKLNRLRISNIRYYRYDKNNNRIILKTDLDEWYYEKNNEKVFDTIFPEKKIESQKEFKVEDYINDFERYMKNIKDKDLLKQDENKKIKQKNLSSFGLLLLLTIILTALSVLYKDYQIFFNIVFIILLISLNKYLETFLQVRNISIKSENDYAKYLNNNKDCQDKFSELKLALNIPRKVEKVYSSEGAEFLVWDNAGYFHLFLNLIYFDVIYISVKIEEVDYYKEEGDICELKIRDAKYIFNNEAKQVFDRLLPNKDYNWIKGLNFNNK